MLHHNYVNTSLSNLNVYHYGFDDIPPGGFYGPAVWDCYLIHFIIDGQGVCTIDGVTRSVYAYQGFLIEPGQIGRYVSDMQNPWRYCYIGFSGTKAKYYLEQAGITRKTPVFSYDKGEEIVEIIRQLQRMKTDITAVETFQLSLIYRFISLLIDNNANFGKNQVLTQQERTQHYLHGAIDFMTKNYTNRVTIQEVANHVGLNPSYLGSLFKKHYEESPQAFLKKYRMEKACELLGNAALSIGDVARSIGYDDQLQFSKIFKKSKGVSPKQYRKDYYMH